MSSNWDPLKDILNMQGRLNRVFQGSFSDDRVSSGEWLPPVDIYETDTEIVILAELPGVTEDLISVQLLDNKLYIKGEKCAPPDKGNDSYYRLERPFGKFSRSFVLPKGIEQNSIRASMKDGVLKITLEKAQKRYTIIKVTKD